MGRLHHILGELEHLREVVLGEQKQELVQEWPSVRIFTYFNPKDPIRRADQVIMAGGGQRKRKS